MLSWQDYKAMPFTQCVSPLLVSDRHLNEFEFNDICSNVNLGCKSEVQSSEALAVIGY